MPEKELYAAVLEKAIRDYQRNPGMRKEILKWIHGKRSARISFQDICTAIDLDEDAVKEKIDETFRTR
jgi:hypothetical protein